MKRTTLVLSTAIAILFVAVLYLLFLNLQKPVVPIVETQVPTVAPTKAITPTTVIDQSTDWKTYSNKELSFEFKYPPEIKYLDNNEFAMNGYQGVVTLQNYPPSVLPNIGDDATFQMLVYTKKNINKINSTAKNIFANDENIIVFENNLNKTGDNQLFNQILSTFKFTNISQATNPSVEAKKFLDAYVAGDWTTTKSLCEDPYFDSNTAASYQIVGYKVLGSKLSADNNYFHLLVDLTTKDGQVHKISLGGTQMEVLMHNKNGVWKAVRWIFFQ